MQFWLENQEGIDFLCGVGRVQKVLVQVHISLRSVLESHNVEQNAAAKLCTH